MPIIRENSETALSVSGNPGLDLINSGSIQPTNNYTKLQNIFNASYDRYKIFVEFNTSSAGAFFVNLLSNASEVYADYHYMRQGVSFSNLSGPNEYTDVQKGNGSVIAEFGGGNTLEIDIEYPYTQYNRPCNFVMTTYKEGTDNSTTFVGYDKTIGWWNVHLYPAQVNGLQFYSGTQFNSVTYTVYGYAKPEA